MRKGSLNLKRRKTEGGIALICPPALLISVVRKSASTAGTNFESGKQAVISDALASSGIGDGTGIPLLRKLNP